MTFSSIAPSLSKDIYEKDGGKEKDAFLKYLKALLVLGGYAEEDAERQAKLYWEADRVLAAAKLEQQDYGNVEKIYNIFTFSELKEMFPKAGLDSAYAISGLAESSQILVSDVGLLKAAAPYFSEEHVDYLKTRLRIELLAGFGGTLNREFQDAAETYQQELLGTSGSITDEYRASQIVQQQFGAEIGRVYAEKYFSPEAKADVEEMVHEFLEIYEQRIRGRVKDARKRLVEDRVGRDLPGEALCELIDHAGVPVVAVTGDDDLRPPRNQLLRRRHDQVNALLVGQAGNGRGKERVAVNPQPKLALELLFIPPFALAHIGWAIVPAGQVCIGLGAETSH